MVSNTSDARRDTREVPCHPAAMPTLPRAAGREARRHRRRRLRLDRRADGGAGRSARRRTRLLRGAGRSARGAARHAGGRDDRAGARHVGVGALAVRRLHLPRNPRGRRRIPHRRAPHRRRPGRVGDRPAGGRRRPPRRGISPRRVRGQSRRDDVGLVIRRRRRRAVRAFDSATWLPARTCRASSSRHSPPAGGARTRRPIYICGPTPSIDRIRCGHMCSAPIPRRTDWSSPNPTSGSKSAWTSPARVRGSSSPHRRGTPRRCTSCRAPSPPGHRLLVRAAAGSRRVLSSSTRRAPKAIAS